MGKGYLKMDADPSCLDRWGQCSDGQAIRSHLDQPRIYTFMERSGAPRGEIYREIRLGFGYAALDYIAALKETEKFIPMKKYQLSHRQEICQW